MGEIVSLEILDRIFGNSPVSMALIDPSGEVVWANGILSQVVRAAVGEGPVALADLFSSRERYEVLATLSQLLHGQIPGDRAHCEGRIEFGEGSGLWVSLFANLIRDGAGEPAFAQVALVDFTDKKKADELISNVAWEWTATFDAMSDSLALIDAEYRLTRVNKAMARLVGVHPRDLVGRKCFEVVHNLKEPWPDCPHRRTLELGESVSAEVVDPNVGIPLHITCSPLRDSDGRVVGSIHIARDISREKMMAEARENLIEELRSAISQVKTLTGLLPICASCKKIRNDEGYWQQLECYISERSDAAFTHGICPDCASELYKEFEKVVRDKSG